MKGWDWELKKKKKFISTIKLKNIYIKKKKKVENVKIFV